MEQRDQNTLIVFENSNFPLSPFHLEKKNCEDIKFSLTEVTSVNYFLYILPIFRLMHIFFSQYGDHMEYTIL